MAANGGTGVEAQEILRWQNAPVASVKKRSDHWECSLLNRSGISTETFAPPLRYRIEQVRELCEKKLVEMGWQPGGNHDKRRSDEHGEDSEEAEAEA
jgi:hypothetical protein